MGDCNEDGAVTVDELVLGINIALGLVDLEDCAGFDAAGDGDGSVSINELLSAVDRALGICGRKPDPTEVLTGTEVSIGAGFVSGAPGEVVTVPVALGALSDAESLPVAIENEMVFDLNTAVIFDGTGQPDCAVNPAIGKEGSFAFQPPGCSIGNTCTGAKAIIVGIIGRTQEDCDADPNRCYNLDSIPADTVLYTCEVIIRGDAPLGIYPLLSQSVGASDRDGVPLAAAGTAGAILVTMDP